MICHVIVSDNEEFPLFNTGIFRTILLLLFSCKKQLSFDEVQAV